MFNIDPLYLSKNRPGTSRQKVLHIINLTVSITGMLSLCLTLKRNNLEIPAVVHRCHVGFLQWYTRSSYFHELLTQRGCDRSITLFKHLNSSFLPHRKLSSLLTKENPLKALLELVLALNSGVRLIELETISLVNSGSICWVSAGPFWKMKQYISVRIKGLKKICKVTEI